MYHNTKYDIPVIFQVVLRNVGYIVAAEFCLQSEGAGYIAEALKVVIRTRGTAAISKLNYRKQRTLQ